MGRGDNHDGVGPRRAAEFLTGALDDAIQADVVGLVKGVARRVRCLLEGTARAIMTASVAKEITRYLRSGDHDPYFAAWPGDVLASARQGSADLKGALVSEIRKRAAGAFPRALPNTDLAALTLRKIGPMVRGLFPAREQKAVLAALERSVVFLTPATIEETILNAHWLHTAWDLANL